MLSRMLGPISVLCIGVVVLAVFFAILGGVAPSEVVIPMIVVAALALLFAVRSMFVRRSLAEHGNIDMFRSINRLRERRGF